MIMMDQNVSAFLTNTDLRGILGASCIDPEQFITAKLNAKSILENINNSNNYNYGGSSEIEEAGGIANLALNNLLDGF